MTLTDDLVFGVCVLTEDGYVPLDQLSLDDIKYVERLIDRNPTCPFLDVLARHRKSLEATCI